MLPVCVFFSLYISGIQLLKCILDDMLINYSATYFAALNPQRMVSVYCPFEATLDICPDIIDRKQKSIKRTHARRPLLGTGIDNL